MTMMCAVTERVTAAEACKRDMHDMQEEALRMGVPQASGGWGGGAAELVSAMAAATMASPALAVGTAAQRMLIEVVLRSGNVGLREYRLPALLDRDIPGNCAALWSLGRMPPLQAMDMGRGWAVCGDVAPTCNLREDWFLLSAPVRFGAASDYALVLFRSDEDGVARQDAALPAMADTHRAALRLDRVYFREDELLADDGPGFVRSLMPFALSVRTALLLGACMGMVQGWQDGTAREAELHMLRSLLQGVAVLAGLADTAGLEARLAAARRLVRGYAQRPISVSTTVGVEHRALFTPLLDV